MMDESMALPFRRCITTVVEHEVTQPNSAALPPGAKIAVVRDFDSSCALYRSENDFDYESGSPLQIGAGVAGLQTAKHLLQAGFRVQVRVAYA